MTIMTAAAASSMRAKGKKSFRVGITEQRLVGSGQWAVGNHPADGARQWKKSMMSSVNCSSGGVVIQEYGNKKMRSMTDRVKVLGVDKVWPDRVQRPG